MMCWCRTKTNCGFATIRLLTVKITQVTTHFCQEKQEIDKPARYHLNISLTFGQHPTKAKCRKHYMNHDARIPVFQVSDQVQHGHRIKQET